MRAEIRRGIDRSYGRTFRKIRTDFENADFQFFAAVPRGRHVESAAFGFVGRERGSEKRIFARPTRQGVFAPDQIAFSHVRIHPVEERRKFRENEMPVFGRFENRAVGMEEPRRNVFRTGIGRREGAYVRRRHQIEVFDFPFPEMRYASVDERSARIRRMTQIKRHGRFEIFQDLGGHLGKAGREKTFQF